MAKRAVLIGINYPGSASPLNGCVNDVRAMEALLREHYDFQDITVLVDTDPNGEQPTGAAIKRHLRALVAATAPGDVAVVHYSGHGTQVRDSNRDERDRLDEALVPCDMNLLTDDDLRTIFAPLPEGAKLTVIADCCHSGTLLDQPEVQIAGPKSDDPAAPPGLPDTFSALFGGADQRGARSLPPEAFAAMIGEKLGVSVAPEQVRGALVALFQGDASAKLAPLIAKVQEAIDAAGGVEGLAAKASAAVESVIPGAGGVAGDLLGAAGGLLGSLTGGGGGGDGSTSRGFGSALFSLALEMMAVPEVASALPPAGAKPPAAAQLPPGKAVLVTGCQSHETSADACPSGDTSKAFGALTNALTTTVREFKSAYPDRNISPRTLVSHVREQLLAQRFAQNPCLESDAAGADAGFIH